MGMVRFPNGDRYEWEQEFWTYRDQDDATGERVHRVNGLAHYRINGEYVEREEFERRLTAARAAVATPGPRDA